MKTPIRVIVVDDHSMVRESLAGMIDTHPELMVVAQAENGKMAIELFHKHKPDVTLIDLHMPGMSGVETIREIRKQYPASRFIALTVYEGEEDVFQAVKAGVQGYLLKGMHFDELLEAILAVHAGMRRIPPQIAKRLEDRINENDLTPRQMEVLRLIVEGSSNKEIGNRLGLTEGTVKQYINSILSKMGLKDRTQAAIEAVRRGLIHLP